MHFTSRSLRHSARLVIYAAAATALAFGLAGSAVAQTLETGPIKVTDNGSLSSGYALKGVTSIANDAGLFGYGSVSTSALNIDGVVGYVQSPQSVGVVGWADSTGTSSYGMYGYSATGPGVYGYNGNGAVASIYGYNTSPGGTAMYGYSTGGNGVLGSSIGSNGVVGMTSAAATPPLFYSGVLGQDNSSGRGDTGVAGTSVNSVGVYGTGAIGVLGYTTTPSTGGLLGSGVIGEGYNGVYGFSTSTVSGDGAGVIGSAANADGVEGTGEYGVYGQGEGPGVYGQSQSSYGTGVVGSSTGGAGVSAYSASGQAGTFYTGSSATAVVAYNSSGSDVALLSAPGGEAGMFLGFSGSAAHPAIVSLQMTSGTDYFTAINGTNQQAAPTETFVVQGASANYSGDAVPTYASDVQMSGDLYVQGRVYQLCSSGSGAMFPVTAPAGHCSYDNDLTPAVRTRSASAPRVTTYTPHQSLPTTEDFGEAQLVNGQASVPLERTFASTIDASRSYLVFITPLGDCRGLYVASRSPNGFSVRELMNGRTNVAFQYRIVAHPYGDASARLPNAATPSGSRPAVTVASIPVHIARANRFKQHPFLRMPGPSQTLLKTAPRVGTLPRQVLPPNVTVFKR